MQADRYAMIVGRGWLFTKSQVINVAAPVVSDPHVPLTVYRSATQRCRHIIVYIWTNVSGG